MIPFLLTLCCHFLWVSQALDGTLKPGESLRGSETIRSSNGVFELGIFSPTRSSSGNHYLGIWFVNDPNKKPVWVGNRENPIFDSSGVLTIRYDGNLVITDRRLIPIIVNSAVLAKNNNTSATLLDSGNLVLKEGESVIWQSFHYPSDTFLPGMGLGFFDIGTDHEEEPFLVSWQSPFVPATGSFALGLYTYNRTILKIWRGTGASREIGFWDGKNFRFLFEIFSMEYNFSYVSKSNEIYLTFNTMKNSTSWFVLAYTGEIQEYKMVGNEISMVNRSICENNTGNSASDCLTVATSRCKDGDEFSEIKGSMPSPVVVIESVHLGISDCATMCKSNCSCIAFSSSNGDGTGCQFHYGGNDSIGNIIGQGNTNIYIRGSRPTLSDSKKRRIWLIVVLPIIVATVVSVAIIVLVYYFRHSFCGGWKQNQETKRGNLDRFISQLGTNAAVDAVSNNTDKHKHGEKEDHELPLLSFSCIARATNKFSAENKLGEGGFGPVYKGTLLGHEIAVKRLAGKSGQGIKEFKNELKLISKLQHRNLVRLLGYCIEKEEKILIYEYMANRSLDSFLFGPDKQKLLDWKVRVYIVEGIAQGLLYLHKYSRLRIIHRDLKTSNILLDANMNPKISDFGMARIFGDNEAQVKTTTVVGTYGYMSPEYAVHGLFSIKSDVFSFGVIMLEIISGRRNTTFCHMNRSLNLLGYAWELWKDGHSLEFVDPALINSVSVSELLLCIQVALLCVQESSSDRPSMSDVVSMLSNESTNLPAPKLPAFSTHLSSSSSIQEDLSSSDITFSGIEAR